MKKTNEYGYPLIESEEEYWEEFKKWKKKFNEITFNRLRKNPHYWVKVFEDVMNEGAEREVISFDYADKEIKRMHKEITAPQRFSMDMKEKRDYVKRKAKEYFKRKPKKDKKENEKEK